MFVSVAPLVAQTNTDAAGDAMMLRLIERERDRRRELEAELEAVNSRQSAQLERIRSKQPPAQVDYYESRRQRIEEIPRIEVKK